MVGLTLLLVAISIGFSLSIIGLPTSIAVSVFKIRKIGTKLKVLATILDIFFGVLYSPLLNLLFLKKESVHKFGRSQFRTISEDLGISFYLSETTNVGNMLVRILNFIDPYHIDKALGKTTPDTKLSLLQICIRGTLLLTMYCAIMILIATVVLFSIKLFS